MSAARLDESRPPNVAGLVKLQRSLDQNALVVAVGDTLAFEYAEVGVDNPDVEALITELVVWPDRRLSLDELHEIESGIEKEQNWTTTYSPEYKALNLALYACLDLLNRRNGVEWEHITEMVLRSATTTIPLRWVWSQFARSYNAYLDRNGL